MNSDKINDIFHSICRLDLNHLYTTRDRVYDLISEIGKLDTIDLTHLEMLEAIFFLYLDTDIRKDIIKCMYDIINRENIPVDELHKFLIIGTTSSLTNKICSDIYEMKDCMDLYGMATVAIKTIPHTSKDNFRHLKLIKDVQYLKSAYEINLSNRHKDIADSILRTYGNEVVIDNVLSYLLWYARVSDPLLDNDSKLYIYIKLYEYNSKDTYKDFSILLKEVQRMNTKKMIPIYESNLGSTISAIILSELDNKGCSTLNIDELEDLCESIGYYDKTSFVSENLRPDKLYDIIKRHFNMPVLEERMRNNFLNRIKELNENFLEYRIVPDFSSGNLVANVINRLDENIGLLGVTRHKTDLEVSFVNEGCNTYICDLNIAMVNETASRMENEIIPYYTVYIQEDLIDDIRSMAGKVKEVGDDVSRKLNKVIGTAVKQLKNIFVTEDREEIIKGGVPKASRLLKMALVHIAIIGVNPAMGIISILVNYGLSSRANDKARSKILNELKAELEIIEEKIKDADGDKGAKYKLMRVRQQINKDMDRIRYKQNLDD